LKNTSAGTETFQGERRQQITATTNIKAEAGRIRRILVQAGVGAVDVYDDPAANTNPAWSIAATAVGQIHELDCPMTFGIRVVMAAAGRLTVIYD